MTSMRGFSMLCAATLAVALMPAVGRAAPGGAAKPRVVVVSAVDLPDSLADIRAQLRATLTGAVTKHGYDLAPDAGSCADRECLKVAAKTTGASDVLVATGGRNDMRGYHVELRIWNVASDREDTAVAECNICAAAQMVDSVATAAGPLLDRVPTLHANLSAPAAPTPAAAPTATPVLALPAPVPAPQVKPARPWIGWTLVGAGLIGGAVSSYLFAIDGDGTDCYDNGCVYHRTNILPASIVAGASVAAIVGGILYLHFDRESQADVALVIRPNGLALGGRL